METMNPVCIAVQVTVYAYAIICAKLVGAVREPPLHFYIRLQAGLRPPYYNPMQTLLRLKPLLCILNCAGFTYDGHLYLPRIGEGLLNLLGKIL